MLRVIKVTGKRLFGALGLEVRKSRVEQSAGVPRAGLTGALRQLTCLGFQPRTVIDVGVAYHTAELYEEFPGTDILLIEPLAEFEPFLRRITERYKAQYVLAAAGEMAGTATLNVHPDRYGSSLLREVEGASVDGEPRQVPVVTIDEVCAEKGLAGPYLIKVDVQGAELQVLAGARRALEQCEAVILEVSLIAALIGAPEIHDVFAKMKEYGFVVYDLWGFNYRPLDGALAQIDVLFVREDGRFRASHAFSTPEERRKQFAQAAAQFERVSHDG